MSKTKLKLFKYINIGGCNGYMYNFNGSPDRMIGIDSKNFLKPYRGYGLSDSVCWLLAMIQRNHVNFKTCLILYH